MRQSKQGKVDLIDDEEWIRSVEVRPFAEKAIIFGISRFIKIIRKFRGDDAFPVARGYPELIALEELGYSRSMVEAAYLRVIYEQDAILFTWLAIAVVTIPGTSVAAALATRGAVGIGILIAALLVYFVLVLNLAVWILTQTRSSEYQLFDALMNSLYAIFELKKIHELNFNASTRGKYLVIRSRQGHRGVLLSAARTALNSTSKMTGLRRGDVDYFKVSRLGIWLAYASKNSHRLDALNASMDACGAMIQHLLTNRPWDIPELPPAPEGIAEFPHKAIDRLRRELKGAKNLLVTAAIGIIPGILAVVVAVVRS